MSTIEHGHPESAGHPPENSAYAFTLLISAHAITDELEDSIYSAGCDDALLHSHDGRVYLDFDRESASGQKAIMSAIHDVERVNGLRVLKVLPVSANAINMANAFLKMRKSPSWKKLL